MGKFVSNSSSDGKLLTNGEIGEDGVLVCSSDILSNCDYEVSSAGLYDDGLKWNFWEEYSQKVQDLMNNPKNMGELTEEDAKNMGGKLIIADFGAESCGDAVRLYWVVDEATEIIKSAKFKSFGCGPLS